MDRRTRKGRNLPLWPHWGCFHDLYNAWEGEELTTRDGAVLGGPLSLLRSLSQCPCCQGGDRGHGTWKNAFSPVILSSPQERARLRHRSR